MFAESKIVSLIAGTGIVLVAFGAYILNIAVPERTWLPVAFLIFGHVLLLCSGLILFALAGLRNMFQVTVPWLAGIILFSFQSVILALTLLEKRNEFIIRFLIFDVVMVLFCILFYFIAKKREHADP